ncbi:MAG: OmpA family protein [Anditalea sp.]
MKYFVLIFTILSFSSNAQNLNGIWEGTFIKDNKRYIIKIHLLSNGTTANYNGISYFSICENFKNGKEVSDITTDFTGQFKNGILETSILKEKLNSASKECLLKGKLKLEFEKSGTSLWGSWVTPNCKKVYINFKFITKKRNIKNIPVFYSKNFKYSILLNKNLLNQNHILKIKGKILKTISLNAKIISPTILFKQSEFRLLPSSYTELNKIYKILDDNLSLNIRIDGHTDKIGKRKYNLILSRQRAYEIKKYLVTKGISKDRITTIGYGDSFPICSPPCAKNRRIEYIIF